MTVALWRIAATTATYEANDLSGTGAKHTGGRWNPVGWDANPAGMTSVQAGEAWLKGKASALLVVPSVIVPEESNILINPLHPDAAAITATPLRKWHHDARYF
ncbi:RES family NAD+ phosphorylase [Janthinobacterium agaricidamnosum]|uniref:RES domain protein n=1 Tax=Janthinobacterium agaricidamnosum NBRC 102515 = DSM 9628 TaxID=1349767 RepID=W0V2T7_9BURK|nr:RES family NAD+ phosphorylase [Janthinobacterium agaricidamnosum]CDG82191.1 RES domain protein [Janthinobacterium agaricidamnosum NBRC 102515 = DSM 9628]